MKASFCKVACFAVILSIPNFANATVIDFNSLTPGPVPGGVLNITADGVPVTFSATGLMVHDLSATFGGERVITSGSFFDPITVTFGGGYTALFAEVENHINGEITSEVDVIMGTAYNAANVAIDTETNSNEIHHLDGPGIAWIEYDDVNDLTAFVIDNFTFEAVPEPTTLGLALVSLLGLGWSRKPR